MLWKHLSAAVGLSAAAAEAFMVVPEVTESDKNIAMDIVEKLPIHDSVAAVESQTVSLDCPGCPVKLRHHAVGGARTDIPNHLELTFSVDTARGVDRLLVNEFELYPEASPWYSPLRAPQVLDFVDEEVAWRHKAMEPATRHLGYTVGIRPVHKEDEGQQLELVEIDLQIIEVGYSFVENVPRVNVKLIKTPSGQLMIGSIDTVEPSPKPSESAKHEDEKEKDEKPECTNVLCSWRDSIIKGLKGLRPQCAKGHSHGHGHMNGHGGGHKFAGHRHHKGQYKHHHTWSRLLKNVTWSIFLPVLIGLVAGVSVAILGMMFGTFVVCVWRLVIRRQSPWMRRKCRRHGSHACHKARKQEAALSEEKSGLLEDQDESVADLPPYEEAGNTETSRP